MIHPDNPYFIFYRGQFVVSWANNLHGVDAETLRLYKVNAYELAHSWADGFALCLTGDRFPYDGNIAFNSDYFAELKSELDVARSNGICVNFVVFSLVVFEADRSPGSRFGQNPWNACLGGPINNGGCPYQDYGGYSVGARKQFLTLENYDYNYPLTEQYPTCSSNWPLERQVQYRTEEIIKKFVKELKEFDNWIINMAWEINDNPDADLTKKWVEWFGGFVHHLDPGRLVFTGEEENVGYATSAATVNGSCHEGDILAGDLANSIKQLNKLGATANSKPKLIVGFDPFDANGIRQDHIYVDNPAAYSTQKNIEYMRAALLAGKGVHPGTAFHAKFYDMTETLRWIKALQNFLETVDSWHNEPQDEIKDSTLPRYGDLSFRDLPDRDRQKHWPRYSNTTDKTPPSTPAGLKAAPVSVSQINLAWQAAKDTESGITCYAVYRNGAVIEQCTSTSFSDTGLTKATTYTYEIQAVNGAGLDSAKSTPVSATTLAAAMAPSPLQDDSVDDLQESR